MTVMKHESVAGGGAVVEPRHVRLGVPGRHVPELGGVCSYADAARPGRDVTETVAFLEAHATLYWIEQGLMPRNTGKGYEYDVAREAGDPLAAVFQDFDWADEVLHVHIGRHIVETLGSRTRAEQLGEEAFARVMAIRRQQVEEEGEVHREWWKEFCEAAIGITPEPLSEEVMASQDAPWKTA